MEGGNADFHMNIDFDHTGGESGKAKKKGGKGKKIWKFNKKKKMSAFKASILADERREEESASGKELKGSELVKTSASSWIFRDQEARPKKQSTGHSERNNSRGQLPSGEKEKRKKANDDNTDGLAMDAKETGGEQTGIVKKGGEINSSLFYGNPLIKNPVMKKEKKDAKKEDIVFAEDLLSSSPHLTPRLVNCLTSKLNISSFTTVQQKTIPEILKGNDCIVESQTGSGKTLAFLIPIIRRLCERRITRTDGVFALILSPTRELASQIFHVLEKILLSFHWIVPGLLIGGEKRKSEKARIRKGINILVCTPGRLVDHIESTRNLRFNKLEFLVFDEADRLLDMGFEKDVMKIMEEIKKSHATCARQTLLFSATIDERVNSLSKTLMTSPKYIRVSSDQEAIAKNDKKTENEGKKGEELFEATEENGLDELVDQETKKYKIPNSLKQFVMMTPAKLRLVALTSLVKANKSAKTIVFMATCESVDFHYDLFTKAEKKSAESMYMEDDVESPVFEGTSFFKLHGNLSQAERLQSFEKFDSLNGSVLLCTDVAARGLDIKGVEVIVQYNVPSSIEAYVHRVGRTARLGQKGESYLFLMPSESEYLKVLSESGIQLQAHDMEGALRKTFGTTKTKGSSPDDLWKDECTCIQLAYERFVSGKTKAKDSENPENPEEDANDESNEKESSKSMLDLSVSAYQSFLKYYTTFPSSQKHIFHIKRIHMGHIAKSFGLTQAPTSFSHAPKTPAKKRKFAKDVGKTWDKNGNRAKQIKTSVSEFNGGVIARKH
eukprot:Nk52_evm20s238 gene=Nk52_evmTU20s238